MLRAVFHSALCLLLLTALVWGGCVSCPQFFMFAKAKDSCCNPTGGCKRTQKAPASDCNTMPLALHQHESADFATVLVAQPEPLAAPAFFTADHASTLDLDSTIHSPPDLLALHSTFLI